MIPVQPPPSPPDPLAVARIKTSPRVRLRNYFLTGLIVAGPLAITLYITWLFITFVDGWVKPLVPAAYLPDAYLPFSIPSLIVPFVSQFRPLWVALGIVSAALLLALAVANHYRRRLSYRFWRRTHYLNFVVWGAASVHGLATGTDRSSWWFLALTIGCVAAVCSVLVLRIGRFRPAPALRHAPVAAGLVSAALVLALGFGPFRAHSRTWNASSFSETLQGQVQQNLGTDRGLVSVAGNGVGGQPVLVRADLLIGNEGLLSTVFQMEYLPSGMSCRGHVTDVQNAGFSATCSTPSGLRRSVKASWEIDDSSTISEGVISVNPA